MHTLTQLYYKRLISDAQWHQIGYHIIQDSKITNLNSQRIMLRCANFAHLIGVNMALLC